MTTSGSDKSKSQESSKTSTQEITPGVNLAFQILCKAGAHAAQTASDDWEFGYAHGLIKAAELVLKLKGENP